MWTRRKLFPTLDVPAMPHPATVTTPAFAQHQKSGNGSFTLDEGTYNFLSSLHYTIVPSLSSEEAMQLLTWALPQSWVVESNNSGTADASLSLEKYKATLATLLQKEAVLQACSQVEYFFFGTDNGQVFQMPLLPPHLLGVLIDEAAAECGLLPGLAQKYRSEAQTVQAAGKLCADNSGNNNSSTANTAVTAATMKMMSARVPINCVGRRLLHRHIREEPVTAMDHLGVLLASAAPSADHAVALSFFHPIPAGVVCIAHPCPVRSLKLWEGAVFPPEDAQTMDEREDSTRNSNKSEREGCDFNNVVVALRQRWGQQVRAAEPVAVYVFTGDDAGVVRLWRVDVVARSYTLQHVLVCSPNITGMLSPLSPFAQEDTTRTVPARAPDRVLHCLDIDLAGHRLFGGTEGGVYVWALDRLPWRGLEAAAPYATTNAENNQKAHDKEDNVEADRVTPSKLAVGHPLCYDEAHRAPLPCALHCWYAPSLSSQSSSPPSSTASPSSSAVIDSEKVVDYRATRLVNHHVWIVDAATVQAEMGRAQQAALAGEEVKVSGWKPKYGRVVTNGAAVGVVSNNACLAERRNRNKVEEERGGDGSADNLAARLTRSVVTVTFDGGELKNDLRVPLSCVIPVVYPAAFLRTPGTACFALRVLAPCRRVLTSCADGKVCVWACKPAEDVGAAETYQPQLVTDSHQEHRGLGRHLCVLRSPDAFVACSFDDGLVKEWHVYDEPELLLRCARRFTLTPHISKSGGGINDTKEVMDMFKNIAQSGEDAKKAKATEAADQDKERGRNRNNSNSDCDSESDDDVVKAAGSGDVVAGISCVAACPAFGALFLVGAFESAIQTYSLTEVVGCEPPRNYIYNGYKTVQLPASMAEDVYREL